MRLAFLLLPPPIDGFDCRLTAADDASSDSTCFESLVTLLVYIMPYRRYFIYSIKMARAAPAAR